uniref:RdRp n=1 Tax=Wenling partiti-like virus 13 TaxID=1923519 RepID=A0A1L3KLR4_9VIRU|nr:RdRp [Wenling partiti-like virus 13]
MSLNKRYAKCKAQGWTRRCPDKVAFGQYRSRYFYTQRVAKRAPWDLEAIDRIVEEVKATVRYTNTLLDVLPLDSVHATFRDLNRSAGCCLCGECKRKSDIPYSELQDMQDLLRSGDPKYYPRYKVAFRTQIRKHVAKRRVILISPGPLAMVEKRFAYPFQKAMSQGHSNRPWATGFDWTKYGGAEALRFNHPDTKSFDFSNFDMSPPAWLISKVFDIIKSAFTLSPDTELIFEGIRASHMDAMAQYGSHRFHMSGGIRTGSSFTHIIGTLVGLIMTKYVFGDVESLHYGDDLLVKTRMSINEACKKVRRSSSFVFSRDKSRVGISWLGLRYVNAKWVLDDPDRRWAQLFLPSKPSAFLPRVQAALLSCGADPMRLELISWLKKGDRATIHPDLALFFPSNMQESYLPDFTEKNIFDLELIMKRHFNGVV